MKIIEFTTYNESSPVTGFGIWLVLDEGLRAHLFHPIHLSELIVTEYDYKSGIGNSLWPTNSTGNPFSASRFMESFKKRVAFFIENRRPFPVQVVAKVIAELEEIPIEEVMLFIRSLTAGDAEFNNSTTDKASRTYQVRKDVEIDESLIEPGRARVLFETLKCHNSPASIYEITSLVEGKLKTKSDLNRVVTYFVNKLTSRGVLEIVV